MSGFHGRRKIIRSHAAGKNETVRGTFVGNARGFGFVVPEEGSELTEDVFIPSACVGDALHKDRVEILLLPNQGGRRREGVVRKVLERGMKEIVGTYHRRKNVLYVSCDDLRFTSDILIERTKSAGAQPGDKVVVRIENYGGKGQLPKGEVLEVLGSAQDAGTDVLAIARAMDLPMEFSDRVLGQAERISEEVLPHELYGREDLRSWQVVTIDGPDAKDLDDAVSLLLDGDDYLLGVHIADVAHYVPESSALDREALKRGTSVYLADRVIPMLPERLSNGICSLNAGVDRLTLSVVMRFSPEGKRISSHIFESVIRVGERLSYPVVRAILEEEPEDLMERYNEYLPMLWRMHDLSKRLRQLRRQRGAIDFDFPEAKIYLDANGIPTDVVAERSNCATELIEEFMLAANETVAETFYRADIPFLYRVHGEPDPEKMEKVLAMMRDQDVPVTKLRQKITPKEIQKALKNLRDHPAEEMLSRLLLRAMQQARYSPECEGHFGLAAKYYTHFTSPIRRYPDLQIHRIIHEHLSKSLDGRKLQHYAAILPDVAEMCSRTERAAAEVERETENLKKAQYMLRHIGETFVGVISSVTSWGAYVELQNTVEGLVRAISLR
ncbi:MAG: ribonuclease R, partial [Lachnospiraceae bacterium]